MARIIDRRLNPKGKSTSNRQRFIKRAKEAIRESLKGKIKDRKVSDTNGGENVNIPKEGIMEPSFDHDWDTGTKQDIRPGNKSYSKGDRIRKPEGGSGGGGGKQGSNDPELGEDEFEFALSKSEFYDIFFEDLELPNLEDKEMKENLNYKSVREGFRKDGSISNLDKLQSYKNSLGRRLALKRPAKKKLADLMARLEVCEDDVEKVDIEARIDAIKKKYRQVPFFDEVDMRYRNYNLKPQPNDKAVMFCVMDVSASMGEHEKDLSKRFFMLLYMFLERKYEHTEIVFIRHHTQASECDEDTFFHSKETGGTVVSSAFHLLSDIQKERYSTDEWNIYIAQCSDGDNYGEDTEEVTQLLRDELLPIVQYMAYIQTEYHRSSISDQYFDMDYGLWGHYDALKDEVKNFDMKQVNEPRDIWKVFTELFQKHTD